MERDHGVPVTQKEFVLKSIVERYSCTNPEIMSKFLPVTWEKCFWKKNVRETFKSIRPSYSDPSEFFLIFLSGSSSVQWSSYNTFVLFSRYFTGIAEW